MPRTSETSLLEATAPLHTAPSDHFAPDSVTPKARREDLDRAKGLGIVLVVLGHIVARSYPKDNEWFVWVHTGLYWFHMPFFMYLSGYVAFLSGAARAPPHDWPALFGKRAQRLLLPFMVFGLAIAVGKMVLAPYLHIDNAPGAGLEDLRNLVWNTDQSVALSIWYLAVLFVLSCVTPVLMRLLRGNTYLLLGLAAVLYFLPVPHVMFLNRAATYFVFFVIGGLAAQAGDRWLAAIDRRAWSSLAILLALVCLCVIYWQIGALLSLLACGIASMAALHGLVRKPAFARSKVLLGLGAYSLVIYLLNTPSIGLAKALMWKIAPWDGVNFLVYAPVLLAAGILIPIAFKKWVFRRVPVLDRITQ